MGGTAPRSESGLDRDCQGVVGRVQRAALNRYLLDRVGLASRQPIFPGASVPGLFLKRRAGRRFMKGMESMDSPKYTAESLALERKIMDQAQVFASAWSLVGGQFDTGHEIEN